MTHRRKTYRFGWRACAAALWMAALAACADDGWMEGAANGGEGLSAYRERMVESRATQPDTWFDEGTKYRIWVTQAESETPDVETGGENGYVGTETVRTDGTHYIEFRAVEGSAERDFYGFTSGDGTVPAERSVNGTYEIARPEGGDYTDYLRGKLAHPYEGAEQQGGILQMPFRHIMSQVCVEVSKSTEVKGEIEVVSVELMGNAEGGGITSEGSYKVYDNIFTFGELATRVLPAKAGALPDDGTTVGIDTVLIFPTFENDSAAETATDAPLTYLRVKFKDDPDKEVYPEFDTDSEGNKQIVVAVYNANTNKPLVFRQNHSYTLHVTFITDQQRVVTLVPQVYNWIEKEGTAENGWMTAEDLGQPVTFNGLLWSDRNLGATSGNPTRSVGDWYNSLGYIYQYGRNIPYYPFTVTTQGSKAIIDYETPADTAFQLRRPIYPLVNPESWGLASPLQTSQVAIISDGSLFDDLVWDLDASQSDGYFGYYNNQKAYSLSNNDWAENTNTPCPPGWRLPTLSEFMGILPSSSFAGNITFRRFNGNEGGNGGWIAMGSDDVGEKEPNFSVAFSERNIGNMTETTTSREAAYKGYFPYIYREEKDDLKDGSRARGVYVLSMAEGDRTHISNREGKKWLNRPKEGDYRNGSYDFNWGVIYGIKNQGTSRAYRMRWSIKLMTDETPEVANDGRLIYQNNPFRGVLVIERFEATATDDFEPDANRSYEASVKSYDWEHPVAVMYLPIGGICDSWSIGEFGGIANIGTEVWYATSETSETDETNENRKKIVWIKFAGSSCKDSQAISTTDRSQLAAAIFIRPVRDF